MCNPNADMDEPLVTALRGSQALAHSHMDVLSFIRSFPAEADPNPPVIVAYKKRRSVEGMYHLTPIYGRVTQEEDDEEPEN